MASGLDAIDLTPVFEDARSLTTDWSAQDVVSVATHIASRFVEAETTAEADVRNGEGWTDVMLSENALVALIWVQSPLVLLNRSFATNDLIDDLHKRGVSTYCWDDFEERRYRLSPESIGHLFAADATFEGFDMERLSIWDIVYATL